MLNFRKVSKIKAEKDAENKLTSYETKNAEGNQKEYEEKVNQFLEYCIGFKKELNKQDPKKAVTVKDIKECFDNSFKEYYKKSKKFSLFSRTTKVLKGMDKKLDKIGKDKSITEEGIEQEIKEAFEYRREMPKGDLIKRSAIDDKAVWGFFNGTLPGIIKSLASQQKQADADAQQDEKKEMLEFVEESLKNAKFENRFKMFDDEINGITESLNEIDNEKESKEYKNNKKIEGNNGFVKKIRENVEKVSGEIRKLKESLDEEKRKLKEYKEANSNDEKFELNVAAYKKTIRKIKNDIDKYSKNLKELKSETKKAAKAQKGDFKLENGTLTISGKQGLSAYWADYTSNIGKYVSDVKSIVMKNVGDTSLYKIENKGGIFHSFEELTSVKAENLSGTIGEASFDGCHKLGAFNKGDGYDYNIPAGVNTIGKLAFYETGKETGGFSANVGATTIGESAFASSGLTKINLPNATEIEKYAFSGCNKLTEVTLGKDDVNVVGNAFDSTVEKTIYVNNEKLKDKLTEIFKKISSGTKIRVELI